MKHRLFTAALLSLSAAVVFAVAPAHANNRNVEMALANLGDVSLFYQALLNTGVASELDENTRYTVFAPTNEAFAQISPTAYPCFYAVQCRAQVADVLRNHIVVGDHTLAELTHEAEVPTIGRYRVYAESPFVGDYDVGTHRVLSAEQMHGSVVYRINGVIIHNQQLAEFRSMPPVADNGVVDRTVVTYHTPDAYMVPGMVPGGGYPESVTKTVVQKTYMTPNAAPSDTVIYPDGTEVTRTERTYVAPGSVVPGGDQATTVTRTITTQP